MKTYITSDLHFYHRSIMKFCPKTRPFHDIYEMNDWMIREWCNTVEPDDLVYILGDISFEDEYHTWGTLSALPGRKILVAGNHDKKLLKSESVCSLFEDISSYKEIVYNGAFIVMCHYPIYDHNRCGRGSIMLHGHRHGDPTGIPGRIMDVGFDATGNLLSLLDDVVEECCKKPILSHHGIPKRDTRGV